MKFKDKWDWRQPDRVVGIQTAVERTCTGDGSTGGPSEPRTSTAEFLAELVMRLHDNGALRDEDVAALVAPRFLVEEQE